MYGLVKPSTLHSLVALFTNAWWYQSVYEFNKGGIAAYMSYEHVEAEAQHSLTSFDSVWDSAYGIQRIQYGIQRMGFSYRSPKRTVTVLKIHSYRTQSDQLPYSCPPEVDPGTVLTVFSYRSLASHVYHRMVPWSWLEFPRPQLVVHAVHH